MNSKLIEKGFVKLQKSILEWQWYTDSNVARLYIHILLKANFTQNYWQGHEIKIGEFITSIDKLHTELNLSKQIVRTALNKLKKTGYIITKTTNRFTLIKLTNSEIYYTNQAIDKKLLNNQKSNSQHATSIELTTTKKEKKENTFEERIDVFKNEVLKFNMEYSNEVLMDFYNYYSRKNLQTGRAKFEEDQYWDLTKKLLSWKNFPKTEIKKTFTKNR